MSTSTPSQSKSRAEGRGDEDGDVTGDVEEEQTKGFREAREADGHLHLLDLKEEEAILLPPPRRNLGRGKEARIGPRAGEEPFLDSNDEEVTGAAEAAAAMKRNGISVEASGDGSGIVRRWEWKQPQRRVAQLLERSIENN